MTYGPDNQAVPARQEDVVYDQEIHQVSSSAEPVYVQQTTPMEQVYVQQGPAPAAPVYVQQGPAPAAPVYVQQGPAPVAPVYVQQGPAPAYVQQVAPEPVYVQQVAPAPVRESVVRRTVVDPALAHHNRIARITQIVYFVFGVLETLIGLRILLRLLGASPDSPFAAFIYNVTKPFVYPFLTLFSSPTSYNSVFEISSLVAIIVYMLLAYFVVRLIWLTDDTRNTNV